MRKKSETIIRWTMSKSQSVCERARSQAGRLTQLASYLLTAYQQNPVTCYALRREAAHDCMSNHMTQRISLLMCFSFLFFSF